MNENLNKLEEPSEPQQLAYGQTGAADAASAQASKPDVNLTAVGAASLYVIYMIGLNIGLNYFSEPYAHDFLDPFRVSPLWLVLLTIITVPLVVLFARAHNHKLFFKLFGTLFVTDSIFYLLLLRGAGYETNPLFGLPYLLLTGALEYLLLAWLCALISRDTSRTGRFLFLVLVTFPMLMGALLWLDR
jgi:hypothetical protein